MEGNRPDKQADSDSHNHEKSTFGAAWGTPV